MTLEEALRGLKDAEAQLSTKHAVANPALISEQMYRLGQFASALEQHLGDAEEEYEVEWADLYAQLTLPTLHGKPLSATAAKQMADIQMAESKGNIKKLQRYVSSAWHVHMSCMARIKHLEASMRGAV